METMVSNSVNANPGIKNSWSLVDFVKTHGRLKFCPNMVNKESGELFNGLACVDTEGSVTFLHFSMKLGELTPAEISAQKSSLQVCQLESGTYSLCKQDDSANKWQDIEI